MDNIIYLILLIIFFFGMMTFVYSKMNGAAVWEDYYAKEIAKVIDRAEPGAYVLDVHKATEVAKNNNLADFNEIFSFDNLNNEICVKLSRGRASCYNYFGDVSVVRTSADRWIYLAEPVVEGTRNRIHFSIINKGGLV